MPDIDKNKLRDLPGWRFNAPIPICLGGDYRALTFCCKPGYSLTFEHKCKRDKILSEIGLSIEKFIFIKEKFSKDNNWDSDIVCFKSLSYCCMKNAGCSKRDLSLKKKYPDLEEIERLEIYFKKKKMLAKILLENIDNVQAINKVKKILNLL
ncbi:MAG: hypothetical protein KGD57_09685 [Candidatus Lokiarchaeota archaeon]|nr:hypothetical protein [Candidatus Lokiarchaeota archaeon]